jgi:adenosylmethionine-8-amino-7-oxononanoate aminotransferase
VPGQAATQEVSGSALLRRSFRKSFPPAVHGEGAYLWDAQGKQYLDFSGSAGVNFIGHGVTPVVAAMTAQARSLEFVDASQFTTPVAEQYAEELLSFAGEKFRGGAVYFCSGGAEALESAEKLARQYQAEIGQGQRSQVLTTCLHRIRDLGAEIDLGNGAVAAVIIEWVNGASLGSLVPTSAYLEELAEICRQNDVLVLADEIATGVGRTGRNFAFDRSGIVPDILVTAKGLSSGYAPLGAVIMSKKVVDTISSGSGSFIRGFAYNSHPISLAAGRAVLNYALEHKLVEAADSDVEGSIAHQLKQNLEPLRSLSYVSDVRGIGLFWRVEFVGDGSESLAFQSHTGIATPVAQAAIERGLLVYPVQGYSNSHSADHLLIAPPAVISSYQVSWACEQLAAAIEQASAHA